MNEQVQQLILAMGAYSELWMVTYNNFIKQGLAHKDALEHTSEFMKMFLQAMMEHEEHKE